MDGLWQLASEAMRDPTSPRWELTFSVFGVDADTMQFGALIYAFLAVVGGGMLATLTGRQGSGRLWSLVILAVGLVPYLALRYPMIFGGILPWGLLFAFRRWGFWRLVIVISAVLMFSSILIGRVRFGGYDAGLAFFEALTTTGWLLLLGFLILVGLRTTKHGLGYIGGAVRQEEYRAARRTETKRFRSWRDRKLKRAGEQLKEGDKYQPRHGRSWWGSRGGGSGQGMTEGTGYDPATGREYTVRGYQPDAHPDPEVRQQYFEGGAGPINGWNYDAYSGLYLPHDPNQPPAPPVQVGGGVRLPMSQRIWRRNP